MRCCKYFIAKFHEAAVLHLDFSDIYMSQLHVVGRDKTDDQTSEQLCGNGQVHTAVDAHFKLCWYTMPT